MSGHIVLGKALYEGGELDEARQTFETALGLDPENLIALRHLGDIARQQGDAYGARQWYQRVLDADPRNEEIAAQVQALDEMPATQAFNAGSSQGPSDQPLPPDLASAPDTLGESTVPDGTLPPALEPSAIAYLAEEPTLEVPAFRAPDQVLDIDMSALDMGAPAARGPADARAAKPPAASNVANDIGLESMEFVAPSRDDRGARAEGLERPEYDFDPHVVDGDVRGETTPAAFVTETMAELYLQQGFADEALAVYRQLLEASPGDANLRARVQQLESGGRSSLAFGVSEEVVRAAQERHARVNKPTARRFFASLAARRAPAREYRADDAHGAYGHEASYEATPMDVDHADASPGDAAPADPYGYGATGVDTSAMDAATLMESPAERGGEDAAGVDTLDALPWETEGRVAPAQEQYDTQSYDTAGYETREYEARTYDAQPDEAQYGAVDEGVPAPDAGYDDETTSLPPSAASSQEETTGAWYEAAEPTSQRGTGEFDVSAFERSTWDTGTPAPRTPTPSSGSGQGGGAGMGGTVDALFGASSATAADEAAAAALAGAFAGTPAAIPAVRPATGELSLDQVFRETPRRGETQRRESSSFSFDQFFSESQGGQTPATPPEQAAPPRQGGENDEQFNAWLEGLKQK
jgi:tetratricopeptide (TPR) repeat protein